jgi:SAM-dependent methyltransferase
MLAIDTIRQQVDDDVIEGSIACASGHTYSITDAIPELLPPDLDEEELMEREWHDQQARELTYKQPTHERSLFSWLNFYQLFELLPLLQRYKPASVLTVMCGTGRELDIWARLTPHVWGVDISTGALVRAKQRAGRLAITGDMVAADVGDLPFCDQSFDIVVVHHGLHHMASLEEPLLELLRVTRRWCILCEPVDGAMRRLLRRSGISPAVEPGGTKVHDISEQELSRLAPRGSARLLKTSRLFYPRPRVTHPTRLYRLADRLHLPSLLAPPMRLFNGIFGRWVGTKGTFLLEKAPEGSGR